MRRRKRKKGDEEAAGEQDISTKIRTHEQALHCISEAMQFANDSNSFLNYCIQQRLHSERHDLKKVERSFFVGSVEEISMSCILDTCNVQCNRALICT
jgi:hypothetical protein